MGTLDTEEMEKTPDAGAAAPGPVFVSGRQFSGNSMSVKILMQAEGCMGFIGDNGYLEHLNQIDAVKDPQARVKRAIMGMRFTENPDLGEMVAKHLPAWIEDHPDADALAIYLEAMDRCVEVTGNRFWLQKATSYIFYADEILAMLPTSKLIYLNRNPYDLCASLKRRNKKFGRHGDRVWATFVGWRKGVRVAERLQKQYPDRFRIVQYEKLVSQPDDELPRIFEFLGYKYEEGYSRVPRVNTSDNPKDWSGQELNQDQREGLSAFRVNYYDSVLTPGEKRAGDILLPRAMVDRWYPNLPHRKMGLAPIATISALGVMALHAFRFWRFQFTRFKEFPSRGSFIVERTLKRMRA